MFEADLSASLLKLQRTLDFLSLRNLNLILNEQYNYNLTDKQIKDIAIKSYKNTMKSFLLPFWIYEYAKLIKKYFPEHYNDFMASIKKK